jgi:hypothetical protein
MILCFSRFPTLREGSSILVNELTLAHIESYCIKISPMFLYL